MTYQHYLVSLGVGLAVGAAYGLLHVRSPAPPVIALLGLLGMLLGESAVSWVRGHPQVFGWLGHDKTFVAAPPSRTGGAASRPGEETSA